MEKARHPQLNAQLERLAKLQQWQKAEQDND
jgi:hypothetical protein